MLLLTEKTARIDSLDSLFVKVITLTNRESRLSIRAVFSVRRSIHKESLLRPHNGQGAEHCEADSSVYGRKRRKEVVICLLQCVSLFRRKEWARFVCWWVWERRMQPTIVRMRFHIVAVLNNGPIAYIRTGTKWTTWWSEEKQVDSIVYLLYRNDFFVSHRL